MNVKRILLIGLILVAVAASISFVAADSSVKVGGIDFNIPDGFTENEEAALDSNSARFPMDDGDIQCVGSYKEFRKGSDGIGIEVYEFDSPDDAKIAQDHDMKSFNGTKKTINGHEGIYLKGNGIYGFNFCKDNCYISVGSTDESLLEKIVSK